MSKFQVGDRVRATGDHGTHGDVIKNGAVYTVVKLDNDGDPILDSDTVNDRIGWGGSPFELYARAGEFVVGDKIIATANAEGAFTKGRMYDVVGTQYGRPGVAKDDSGVPNGWSPGNFRLATPEEIAAAEAKTVELTGAVSAEQAARFAVRIDANQEKNLGWEIFNPEIGKTVFHHVGEIPAADFDFSTIKAGDEVLVRLKLARDGMDEDGEVLCRSSPARDTAAQRFISREEIVSVIPAPKPKTLRERAIEAAGEAWTATIGGQNVVDSIVDAVLAEVEKGQ